MNRTYRDGQFKTFLAKDLDEAYKHGFFQGSMTRYELMDRITKYNPDLKWFATKTHRALWDVNKGDRGFICGITHNMIIPKYSVMEYNFNKDKKITWCTAHGEKLNTEIVNQDENEYKALARGWLVTLAIVKNQGYIVDERGL